MTTLAISRERDGAQQIILLAGELNLATSGDLLTAGTTALADPDIDTVVLDLAGVTFIDSSGLSALVQMHTTALSHNISLAVQGVTEQALRIMRLTALDTLLTIKDRVQPK